MADSKKKEEQARKAHALAEKCFLAGNVSGARQWMQSAVRLAPDLPGTQQIVAAYDVHAAAGRSRGNWYGMLDLKPSGAYTHDDIKKQYRRLCLLVHPDKNPSAAADGAFKLIHAAWDALSATHPPLGTAVPAPPPPPPQRQQRQAAPPRPPKPQPRPRPPEPKPQPRPRPPEPKPQRPPRQRPRPQRMPEPPTKPEPAEVPKRFNKCSHCGAETCNGRGNYRCGSCMWSPMDGSRGHQPHDYDDDRHEDPNEDDYYYDEFFNNF